MKSSSFRIPASGKNTHRKCGFTYVGRNEQIGASGMRTCPRNDIIARMRLRIPLVCLAAMTEQAIVQAMRSGIPQTIASPQQ